MQAQELKLIYNKSLHAQYNSHNTKVSQMLDKPTTKGCESTAGWLDDRILCKFGDAMLYQSINILYLHSSMIVTPKMASERQADAANSASKKIYEDLSWVGINYEAMSWYIFWPLRILFMTICYQIMLVIFGTLAGQRTYFWRIEKRMLRRFGIRLK